MKNAKRITTKLDSNSVSVSIGKNVRGENLK